MFTWRTDYKALKALREGGVVLGQYSIRPEKGLFSAWRSLGISDPSLQHGGSAKTSEKCCRANLWQLTRFSRCSATQKTSGSFLTVVDFVAVRAPKNHKDQQG
jgi:hypothetical protein